LFNFNDDIDCSYAHVLHFKLCLVIFSFFFIALEHALACNSGELGKIRNFQPIIIDLVENV